jgi:VIT1/CCC1 family predicted Fe2+/Mn2+ transporter
MVSFLVGALLPLLAIVLPPESWRLWVTFGAVTVALAATGVISARLGGAPWGPAVLRNVGVGVLAMLVTFAVGSYVGGVV